MGSPRSSGCARPRARIGLRPPCGASPESSRTSPGGLPPTPKHCWPTHVERCAGHSKAGALVAAGGKDAAAGRQRGRLRREVNDLNELLEVTQRIAAKTRVKVANPRTCHAREAPECLRTTASLVSQCASHVAFDRC